VFFLLPSEKTLIMSDIRFFLKVPSAKKETLIYIIYSSKIQKIKFKVSSRLKIVPENWDQASQQMKKRKGLPYINFNRNLELINRSLGDIIFKLMANHTLTNEKLKQEFAKLSEKEQEKVGLIEFTKKQVDYDNFTKTKSFGSLKSLLISFLEGKEMAFEDVTPVFLENFTTYLEKKQYTLIGNNKQSKELKYYSANYINRLMKTLRRVMNIARKEGLTDNIINIKETRSEDVFKIYLTVKEIRKIKNTIVPESLEKVRDLFVIGCWTGMRSGNYFNINPKTDIDRANHYIYAIVNKNGPRVKIPMSADVREIIDRYDGLPKSISDVKFNKYIKEVCKLAGLNQPVIWSRTEGGKQTKHVNKKWEMVTSHTARRSFATNARKAKIPDWQIMQITGHKKLTTFLKYVKSTQEETAEELSKNPFFN